MMRKIAILLTLLLWVGALYSQEKTVTGKVIDETGNGMPGATVQLKGTTKGTVTDINGSFSLSVPVKDAVLVFSYVGYTTQEITVGDQNVIEVNLKPEVQSLEQVVVVGYGVQKKSLVTGSISKIDSKDITTLPAARIDQALQGKTAGVYIAQSSGAPGGAMSVKIRGNSSDGKNEPLYIVNGVKTGNIDFLSPSDIESIEILKDAASAAIYGSEGGNGVVIITTKKAQKGISQINYNYYHGWQSAAHLIQPMNKDQYIQYAREALAAEGKLDDKAIAKYNAMEQNGVYTNWMDEIFGTAPMDEHNFSLSTGNETSNILLSGAYLTQDGIVGGSKSNFTRYTFNVAAESQFKPWIKVGSHLTYTNSRKNNLNENAEFSNGVITSAMYFDPTIPVFYRDVSELPAGWGPNDAGGVVYDALVKTKDGKIYRNSDVTFGDVSNPLALIENTYNNTKTDKLLGDVNANLTFFKWLTFTSKVGIDYELARNYIFNPKFYYDQVNSQTNDSNVTVQNLYTRQFNLIFDNYLTFNTNLMETFNIDGVLGMSYEDYLPTYIYAVGGKVPYNDPNLAYLHNTTITKTVDGGEGLYFYDSNLKTNVKHDLKKKLNSYFGRLAVNYKEFLMGQVNFRRDGSSLFGPNKRYSNFPSFSVGINLSKLDAIKEALPFLTTSKIRYSWGKNGSSQVLGPFQYTSTMVQQVAYVDANGNYYYGAYPKNPANPNLKWEESVSSDIGADIGLFNNKLTITIDRYVKTTTDQLSQNARVSYYHGFYSFPFENSGKVENKGWEFEVTYREMDKPFKYTIGLNASYQKNKVLTYGAPFKTGYRMNTGDFVTYYEPGYPVWYFKGFKVLGVFQDTTEIKSYKSVDGKIIQPRAKPGDLKFADINADGKINDNDRTMIGKPNPDWLFGFNFSCNFKWLDFNMFWQGVSGNQIFFAAISASRGQFNKPEFYFTERWYGPGTSNWFPRATYDVGDNLKRATSINVHDADYLRLKNITLGLTLPSDLTTKLGIAKLRIYGTATNVLTFTKYKGTDPELGQADINDNSTYGIDRGLYPQARTFTAGINVTF